jgi:RimJ/RimL family protein N-acetyltransferase
MVPVIETERLRLRAWEERDFPAYAAFRADPARQAFLGLPMTLDQAWERFSSDLGVWVLRGYGIFAMAERAHDEAIGYTGLWFPPDIAEPELSWSLFSGQTGRGYATEAAAAARSWVYDTLGLPPLMSLVHPHNRASIAVANRLGAVLEKEIRLQGAPRHLYRHPGARNKTS